MPRKARISVPGCVTHVMARCLDGIDLFTVDTDRIQFLELLRKYIRETDCRCYAWALMRNHYHIVIRTGALELWRTMKPLNMRYAQFHARRHGRRGPLFMDRYKSIATQDQRYIQELVRYVHLNPIRAGVCRDLDHLGVYPWTGDAAIMGNAISDFQDTQTVLRCFGEHPGSARKLYREYLAAGLDSIEDEFQQIIRANNSGVERGRDTNRWIIGDPEFTRRAISQATARKVRVRSRESELQELKRLAKKLCETRKISEESLRIRHRGGPISECRRVFAYLAIRKLEISTSKVAEYLNVTPGAASNMIRPGMDLERKMGSLKI